MYPSVDLLLVTWGNQRFTDLRWADSTPANLQEVLPFVTLARYGGQDPVITIDEALVDVDVWAATRSDADSWAKAIRSAITLELPGLSVVTSQGSGRFLRTRTTQAPIRRPTANPDLSRIGASYEIRVQSH